MWFCLIDAYSAFNRQMDMASRLKAVHTSESFLVSFNFNWIVEGKNKNHRFEQVQCNITCFVI